MELKTSPELFLGLQEQRHMVKSLGEKGYKRVVKSMAVSYGVVKTADDMVFNSLKVFASGINQVSIRKGLAIDKNINCIDLPQDIFNVLTIPTDDVPRFVVIKYAPTVIEEGTVSIQADGSIFGTATKFTERLRGIPNFPSKIVFPNSTNNISEYTVLSVQSDTIGALNVNQGQMVPEANQKYAVVGTFTPGEAILQSDKFPFVGDGFVVELRTTLNTLIEGLEFVLAEVKSNGITLSIVDRRPEYLFSVLPTTEFNVSQINPIIGVEKITFDNIKSVRDKNLMSISWGITSVQGQWGIDTSTQEMSISSIQGGKWSSTSDMTDGILDGWRVIFNATGQSVSISNSFLITGQIVLKLDYLTDYPSNGSISIVPSCTFVEISIKNATNPVGNAIYTFGTQVRTAVIPVLSGSASIVSYRHLSAGDDTSIETTIGDGTYYKESAFNEAGQLILPDQTQSYVNGLITPISASISFPLSVIERLVVLEKKTAVFEAGGGMVYWRRPAIEIPDGWTEVIDWRGRIGIGWNPDDPEFSILGMIGGSKTVSLTAENNGPHDHDLGGPVPINGEGGFNLDGDRGSVFINKTESSGNGEPFSILNPYRTVMFIEYIG